MKMKKVPVYLSEEEIELIQLALQTTKHDRDFKDEYKELNELEQRLEEELKTFEE